VLSDTGLPKDNLKVAIVTSFPRNVHEPVGGVQVVSVNLARALARFDDLELHVVTTDRSSSSPEVYGWNSVTVHRLPWKGRRILLHATVSGRRLVRDYLSALSPDVIHTKDFYGLMVKGMSVPRVFTIHGFIHADTLRAGGRLAWLRWRLWRWVETAGWAEQPHIVSISPYVREALAGVARGRIHDIENPIGEEFFHVERREEKGTIFYAGPICPRKNILGLLQAFTGLCRRGVDARLRIAGSATDTAYERRVHGFIRENRLSDRVDLLGNIPPQRVCDELARASVFVLISYEEGAPLSISEAMAAGVPVVASDRCGMPYMIRHGESGYLVDPDDTEDVARHISILLEDEDLRQQMGDRAKATATERFHPVRVAQRHRDLYYAIAREHNNAASSGR